MTQRVQRCFGDGHVVLHLGTDRHEDPGIPRLVEIGGPFARRFPDAEWADVVVLLGKLREREVEDRVGRVQDQIR